MKQPPRRRSITIYDFLLVAPGQRPGYEVKPSDKLYAPYHMSVSASNNRTADIDIQGRIFPTDKNTVDRALTQLKAIGAKMSHFREHVVAVIRPNDALAVKPYPYDWKYQCNFSLRIGTAKLSDKKSASIDKSVAAVYKSLAEELGFPDSYVPVNIFHSFLHLAKGHWEWEATEFNKNHLAK